MKVKQILTRIYVNDLDKALLFYEKLTDEKCQRRLEYKQARLEIARISNLLLISGKEEALRPFKDTSATFLVDSINAYKDFLLKNGATIIRDIQKVPTGFNLTVKHNDGTIVEYVEHH
jgi:predicted enzyme related to lactoylglutathione lyase